MAKKSVKLQISVELLVQKTISETIQNIHDEYGLTINSLRVTWLNGIDGKCVIQKTEMVSSVSTQTSEN